jgi:SAM-dependent methyltransferase
MNYFSSPVAAQQYKQGRPDFHAGTISRVREFLGIEEKLACVLDVACGTGLSTKALLPIAHQVYGTDHSAEMLKAAFQHPNISYAVAKAEQQPFADNSFDLITVCSGVHWFQIDAFLSETARLLKRAAWLLLYDNFFQGESIEAPGLKDWYETVYLQKFPPPPRADTYDWNATKLRTHSLELVREDLFSNAVVFDKEGLLKYLITQSNIIAAVESGSNSYPEIEAWLLSDLSPFFQQEDLAITLRFDNWIKYLRPL